MDYEARAIENSLRYKAKRDASYEQGWEEFDQLVLEPTFRDFVCMYIGEGYKRSRHTASLCNSDPKVVVLADRWIRRLRRIRSRTRCSTTRIRTSTRSAAWADLLHVDATAIRVQRKSNSNQLNGRTWRSRHGVLNVISNDTLFRARLQAWIDRLTQEWLDSAA